MDATAVVRLLFERAWNEQDFDALRDRVAPGITFHHGGATFTTDVAELEGLVDQWRTAFPDLRFEVDDLVAEGDLVAARLRFTGRREGTWEGVEATGRRTWAR